jgi:hypothetical protein
VAVTITFSYQVPDAATQQRLIDGVCGTYGYTATVPDPANPAGPPIANPETRAQFARRQVRLWLFQSIRDWEAQKAADAANAAAAAVDAQVQLT